MLAALADRSSWHERVYVFQHLIVTFGKLKSGDRNSSKNQNSSKNSAVSPSNGKSISRFISLSETKIAWALVAALKPAFHRPQSPSIISSFGLLLPCLGSMAHAYKVFVASSVETYSCFATERGATKQSPGFYCRNPKATVVLLSTSALESGHC